MPASIQAVKICTTWGTLVVQMQSENVVSCTLPLLENEPPVPFAIEPRGADPVSAFIAALFSGQDKKVPPLGKLEGSEFQRQVWNTITAIPRGDVLTYGELARAIGRPQACRAVANACGANPAPLFIPCHRVVGANHLGGFSAGMAWKQLLLSLECAPCI